LGDEKVWVEIPDDVCEGVGEQWDVYRQMRDIIKGEWEDYHPITNVMVCFISTTCYELGELIWISG